MKKKIFEDWHADKLVHLFQASPQEFEELPCGGLSLSIVCRNATNATGWIWVGLGPNNPDGGLFIVAFLADK